MNIDDIVVPRTSAATAALDVATTYSSPALLNHAVRSYLWAAYYGAAHGVAFDAELLYVAAILHDMGLVTEFDNATVAFEDAGAHLAWVFAAGAGWSADRRTRVSHIIVKHMWDEADVVDDPESQLLELSTGFDVSGRHGDAFPAELRADVMARFPRMGFGPEFVACFQNQALRKPDSRAAQAVRSGIADRVATHPLDA